MYLTHLLCTACGRREDASVPQTLCAACGKPLFAQYDLAAVRRQFDRDSLVRRPKSMWRYRELLPVSRESDIVSLGEGMTPLLSLPRLARRHGLGALWVKDESQNPTQSFKARGMSAAVSMAKQFGLTKLAVPSAGNAANALAAYAARAGIEAHVSMPKDTSQANVVGSRQLGAHVTLVEGLITDCAAQIDAHKAREGWFDVATLKEPYRVEGKKTLGFELAEQFGWILPDVIIYPTGGGSGLIGMWKAFDELEAIGWIGEKRPRMFSVQACGCAPIVRAFEQGDASAADQPAEPGGRMSGLRVPRARGDFIILNILRKSGGGALAVTEGEILSSTFDWGRLEGIFASPEGAAGYAGLKRLLETGAVRPDETIVLFNTGAGVKYLDWYQESCAVPGALLSSAA